MPKQRKRKGAAEEPFDCSSKFDAVSTCHIRSRRDVFKHYCFGVMKQHCWCPDTRGIIRVQKKICSDPTTHKPKQRTAPYLPPHALPSARQQRHAVHCRSCSAANVSTFFARALHITAAHQSGRSPWSRSHQAPQLQNLQRFAHC